MNGKTFFIVGVILLCVFLSGVFIGATIATKAQKEIDRQKIEAMTEQNECVLDRVENLNAVIENMLGLRRTKDIVIARPGTED